MTPLLLLLSLLQIEAKDRCVLVGAEVRKSPPQIELRWNEDPKATGYAIFRKAPSATTWGDPRLTLDSKETRYADTEVEVGVAYEYMVLKSGMAGDKAYKG